MLTQLLRARDVGAVLRRLASMKHWRRFSAPTVREQPAEVQVPAFPGECSSNSDVGRRAAATNEIIANDTNAAFQHSPGNVPQAAA
jgi:hypothetical protein